MPDLNHRDPGPTAPAGWTPAVTHVVVVDYDPSVQRKVIFRKSYHVEVPTPPDSQFPIEPAPPASGELLHHIAIAQDCYILIWLSHKVDWHWHKSRAITLAQNLPSQYFKLQYLTATGWVSQPSQGQTTRCIRFGAKYRGPRPATVEDLFNLNIELENPDGSILPITIDPDIQNPKV